MQNDFFRVEGQQFQPYRASFLVSGVGLVGLLNQGSRQAKGPTLDGRTFCL